MAQEPLYTQEEVDHIEAQREHSIKLESVRKILDYVAITSNQPCDDRINWSHPLVIEALEEDPGLNVHLGCPLPMCIYADKWGVPDDVFTDGDEA